MGQGVEHIASVKQTPLPIPLVKPQVTQGSPGGGVGQSQTWGAEHEAIEYADPAQ